MKKKLLFTLATLLAIATQMSAGPVSKQDALKEAQAFMQTRGMKGSLELQEIDGPRKAKASGNQTPSFYVFNNGQDGGFVIISGDDRTQKVLGYSDKGHFDLNDMSESTETLLDQYVNDMEILDKMDGLKKANASAAASSPSQTPTATAVQPLMTVNWHQLDPFNQKCPAYTSSKKCALGCTALAMGQLIYHYRDRMPAKLETTIPGYTCSSHSSIKPASINKGVAFNWDKMFDKHNGSQTSTQLSAVANFLYYVAVSIKSDFWGTTTAYLSQVAVAMPTYFGFTYPTYLKRNAYTYPQWKSKIIEELEQGRPVFYYAASTSGSAHSFIVDGYDGGDLFHVNWGWGGNNDGYFSLSILDPLGEEGKDAILYNTAYSYNNSAFFNLQPVNGYTQEDKNTNLTSVINSVSGTVAKVTYTNNNTTQNTYTCGLGIRNASNNILVLKTWDKGNVVLGEDATTGSISYTLSYSDFKAIGLGDGTYKIFPICKLKNEDFWVECDQNTSFNYIVAKIASNQLSSLSKGSFSASLSVSKIEFPGPCLKSTSQPVITTVKNTGDEFVGTLYLFASKTTTKGTRLAYTKLYIPNENYTKVQMNFTPKETGTYNVWVATDANGDNVIGQSKVTFASGTYSRNLAMTSINVKNIKEGTSATILGTTFEGTVTVKNNASYPCAERVTIFLFSNKSGWIGADEQHVFFLELQPGKSTTIPFKFENLGVSWKYGLAVMYPDNSFIKTNPYKVGYVTTYAPMCYSQDGTLTGYTPTATFTVPSDAVAVDLTGTTGTVTKVVPNSNPNTIYYIGSNESVISGLSGKNVVKGGSADNITLVNEKPFFTPKSFVAKKISFSLVPAIGVPRSGVGGWQTLTLPFAASQVTCNNNKIDWFKSDHDTKKYFWIKEFSAIAGLNTVCLGYTQELKANHPYLYAVPNNEWGASNSLVGKTLVFSAENAKVYAKPNSMTGSSSFNFRGSYSKQTLSNIYTLNAAGTYFVKGDATVKPFNCYFIATSDDSSITSLNLASFDEDELTKVEMNIVEEKEKQVSVYNLSGLKVGHATVKGNNVELGDLPKGIYIVNGKKIVK